MKTLTYFNKYGITESSSKEDIKKAYRKLSKIYHPDIYKDDGSAFKDVSNEYEYLLNPHDLYSGYRPKKVKEEHYMDHWDNRRTGIFKQHLVKVFLTSSNIKWVNILDKKGNIIHTKRVIRSSICSEVEIPIPYKFGEYLNWDYAVIQSVSENNTQKWSFDISSGKPSKTKKFIIESYLKIKKLF